MVSGVRKSEVSGWLLAFLLVFPVLSYLTLLAWQYVPLPNEDDYHALFGFALKWQQAPDLLRHLQLIAAYQHNEYKMPLPYGLLSLELWLTHHFSIPLWTWVWESAGFPHPGAVLAVLCGHSVTG